MAKRKEHIFEFKGSAIAAAATSEAEYHRNRTAWWAAEFEKAVGDAKSSTIQVREYDVTGGKRADIVIDPSVQSRLNEARNKIATHQREADQFKIEAAAYGTQPDRPYELDTEDVMHFRLAGGERET